MKRIDEWLIDSFGSIVGSLVDEDGKLVTTIATSRVVKREGNTITTRTGSRYELLEPSPVHMSRFVLDTYYDGAKDPLAAIDCRLRTLATAAIEE